MYKNIKQTSILSFAIVLFFSISLASNVLASSVIGQAKYGESNANVTAIQNILISKGYLKSSASGHFGPATFAAVKAFQKDNGLSSVGTVGPKTATILSSFLSLDVVSSTDTSNNSSTNNTSKINCVSPTIAVNPSSLNAGDQIIGKSQINIELGKIDLIPSVGCNIQLTQIVLKVIGPNGVSYTSAIGPSNTGYVSAVPQSVPPTPVALPGSGSTSGTTSGEPAGGYWGTSGLTNIGPYILDFPSSSVVSQYISNLSGNSGRPSSYQGDTIFLNFGPLTQAPEITAINKPLSMDFVGSTYWVDGTVLSQIGGISNVQVLSMDGYNIDKPNEKIVVTGLPIILNNLVASSPAITNSQVESGGIIGAITNRTKTITDDLAFIKLSAQNSSLTVNSITVKLPELTNGGNIYGEVSLIDPDTNLNWGSSVTHRCSIGDCSLTFNPNVTIAAGATKQIKLRIDSTGVEKIMDNSHKLMPNTIYSEITALNNSLITPVLLGKVKYQAK